MLKATRSGGVSLPRVFRWSKLSIPAALAFSISIASGVESIQKLQGHVPVPRAVAQSRLSAEKTMHLSISLPLRNRQELEQLVREVSNPSSPQYGKYLTPDQFTKEYGPSQEDYDAIRAYAQSNGFKIVTTHPNRTLIGIEGTVTQIENTFGVTLNNYEHPSESRLYYAPDTEPTLKLATPVLNVRGLDNYNLPKPHFTPTVDSTNSIAIPKTGSGSGGAYLGYDFRKAYVPNTTLTGSGQVIGLFEMDGYYASDITAYLTSAGLPSVALQNVLLGDFNGTPVSTSGNQEVSLDIEVAIAMAPGLSKVIVYEGSPSASISLVDEVLNRMATDNAAKQLSCSWGFDIDATTEQIFLQYAAQGQSFFLSSGDSGAFSGVVDQPSDSPYITVVGGTILSTSTTGSWLSETTWSGSGGGISTVFSIPSWQNGIISASSKGSYTMRNTPDVAMVAYNVQIIAKNGKTIPVNGTSISAPLWAGFTALANQRAATLGKPAVGFINPVLYSIGKDSTLKTLYHDITTGNNRNSDSPTLFSAVSGYDLCTGLGTPKNTNLIEAILSTTGDPLGVTSPLGFISIGPVKGSFSPSSQIYYLTNTGTTPLGWSIINTTAWLSVSSSTGTLNPGAQTAVTVSVNSTANSLLISDNSATLTFQNTTSGVNQTREFTLSIGNGGFEIGDFTYWNFNGQSEVNFAVTVDYSRYLSSSLMTNANDWEFVGSGILGAFLGQNTNLGYLSQTLPTKAGQSYILSFWYSNPVSGIPNEFKVSWNNSTLYDGVNLSAFTGVTKQYIVKATGTSTLLQFGFRNDENAFGLDNVTVIAVPSPSFQGAHMATDGMELSWTTISGVTYQVQYTDKLSTSTTWTNLGAATTATTTTLSVTDEARTTQRFYRVVIP